MNEKDDIPISERHVNESLSVQCNQPHRRDNVDGIEQFINHLARMLARDHVCRHARRRKDFPRSG